MFNINLICFDADEQRRGNFLSTRNQIQLRLSQESLHSIGLKRQTALKGKVNLNDHLQVLKLL